MTNRVFVRLALFAAVAAATWLRWRGTTYGLPEITHPDEPYIVEAAMRMAGGAGLHPETFYYPSLQFYVDALVFRVAAAFADLELPTLYRIARTVTVVFAAGTISLTYLAARRLTDGASALAAVALLSVSFLHVSNSYLATTDVPMGFWALLTAFAALRLLRPSPSFADYAIAAVCAGCATGTKYNGVFAVLPIIVAHLAGQWRGVRSLVDPRLVGAGAISAIVFFLTTPYALIDNDLFREFLELQSRAYSLGHPGNESVSSSYGFYAGAIRDKFGAVSVAVSLAGWLALLWTRTRPALVLISFPLALFGFMGFYPVRFDRNIVSVIPFLAIGAAGLVAAAASLVNSRSDAETSERAIGIQVVPVLVLLGLVGYGTWVQAEKSLDHVRVVTLVNTRFVSRQWVEENLPAGAKIGREHYTPAVDSERFLVDELGFFGLIRTPNLTQYEYLIASGGDFARYVNNPDRYPREAHAYQNVFGRWDLVKTFQSDWTRMTGPEIRIYKRRETAQ